MQYSGGDSTTQTRVPTLVLTVTSTYTGGETGRTEPGVQSSGVRGRLRVEGPPGPRTEGNNRRSEQKERNPNKWSLYTKTSGTKVRFITLTLRTDHSRRVHSPVGTRTRSSDIGDLRPEWVWLSPLYRKQGGFVGKEGPEYFVTLKRDLRKPPTSKTLGA